MSAENSNIEAKSSLETPDQFMIHVLGNETVKEALERFNEAHNCSLSEDQVKDWERLDVSSGFFILSPAWRLEDFLLRWQQRIDNIVIEDKRKDSAEPLIINGNVIPLNGKTFSEAIQDFAKGKGIQINDKNTVILNLSTY